MTLAATDLQLVLCLHCLLEQFNDQRMLQIFSLNYLTIRLRARDFYALIVDEGEATYHLVQVESE